MVDELDHITHREGAQDEAGLVLLPNASPKPRTVLEYERGMINIC